jgi:ribosomal protein S18 acetylase RimI-like enzyme
MTTALVRTREATADDLGPVLDLYARCSPQTLEQRFHLPVTRPTERLVAGLVRPRAGWSIVAEQGDEVLGHGVAGRLDDERVEIGLLVDDAFQGTGVGSHLVRDLARSAAARGYRSLVCLVEPDNESVLPTVRRAGLEAVTTEDDGLLLVEVPLATHVDLLRHPA